jgi:hypothetical protein
VKEISYLHVEAINFTATLFDTQDLSTVRGSSLAALNAMTEINTIKGLTQISLGASIGLWSFLGDPDMIKAEVRRRLAASPSPFKYLTFAIETCEATNFTDAKEKLITQVRRYQLQTTLKKLDYSSPEKTLRKVCQLDYVSPANQIASIKGNKETYVSQSVYDRRDYGRKAKQDFYDDFYQVPNKGQYPFALHFSSICEQNNVREQLKGKIAVFYADGNSFSKKINNAFKKGVALETIDDDLRGYRKAFLTKAFEELVINATGKAHREELKERIALKKRLKTRISACVIRFETLLWGGDEFMFVMPARLGFEFAKLFYDAASTWEIGGEDLKFASGLVFCHHKAPISRIAALAKNLAEKAKEGDNRKYNLINALVLESFDHVGSDFSGFWGKRHPAQKILTKVDMNNLIDKAIELNKTDWFSRRQLKSGAFALHRGEHNKRDFETILKHMHKMSGDKSKAYFLDNVDNKPFWLQLDEFWDYLVGETENA